MNAIIQHLRQSVAQTWWIDRWLLLATLALITIGVVMITSSAVDYAERLGDPWFFVRREIVYLCMATVVAVACMMTPSHIIYRYSAVLLAIGLILLIAVLIPGIGKEVNGSRRWIPLGFMNFQSSEAAKMCLVAYLAGYLVRRGDEVRTGFYGFVKPIIVMISYAVLLLLEPDFGATVVIVGMTGGVLFLAGAQIYWFILAMVVSGTALFLVFWLEPYRMQRFTAFLDPWSPEHVFGTSYQLTQSLIGIGRGGWFGVGLGNSIQKLAFLPEAHTDFVFAIIGEELGVVGHAVVLALYGLLVARMMRIGWLSEQAGRIYGAYLCYGFALIMALQVAINVGVNIGLLPTKGLTLPFLSWGGSSLLVSVAMVAICQRVHHELHAGGEQ